MKKLQVIILDFGGQYTQLIARKVRECEVYCEILPYNTKKEDIISLSPKAIIFSGGPSSVYDENAPLVDPEILKLNIPVLGICYGMQLIAKLTGGTVIKSDKAEYGFAKLKILRHSKLFEKIENNNKIWMSHKDIVTSVDKKFLITGRTENCPIVSFESDYLYGLQFHPEVAHTKNGKKIFENFLYKIANCKKDWSVKKIVSNIIEETKEKVKEKKVICAVSGGVDSTIMAYILKRSLGKNFKAIFINNGLLRKNEENEVIYNLKNRLKIPIKYVNASKIFLSRLKGIVDPEKKRKIIGNTFIEVFFKNFKDADFLAQGTLYPDVIESTSVVGPSSKIKTHHNRVKKILDLMKKGRVIEPFKFLFKDEVRKIGKELGLPEDIIWRMPFPGPGLAIRILGEVTPNRLKILREADAIVREEIEKNCKKEKIWQAFAVLLPVKSVGVMGDRRTYNYTVAIRIVESVDGMTADWVKLQPELIEKISNRIINEVEGINRVVYDVSSKPPATIEWE